MAYIQHLDAQAATARTADAASANAAETNFLAQYWGSPQHDQAQGVIFRDELGMILLNRFPYANGHLLVALGDPRATLGEYTSTERAHFWRLMDLAMALCQEMCQPQGMNVGLNIGRAAGAGLPQHIHGHVVPRWTGDCNLMSVLGNVRVIPDALEQSYQRYRAVLPAVLARTL
jgi:ATP adenylyltransferase